jgi:YbbR domain-containing protein
MKTKEKITTKIWLMVISFTLSCILFLSVSTFEGSDKKEAFFSSSTEGTYVIENIEIDYKYDKTKYEVVPFVTEPYAVVKGNKQLINILKWSGKPEFFLELTGRLPGSYREEVEFTGINKDLEVTIYPSTIDLRLMEQQTLTIKPTLELTGVEDVRSDLIVSTPEILTKEVKVRGIQDRLNQIGQIKGILDVSKMHHTEQVEVNLIVYDRDGKVMKDINLIDKVMQVNIPIEKKVTIINEAVINKIVIVEGEKEPEAPIISEPIKEPVVTEPLPPEPVVPKPTVPKPTKPEPKEPIKVVPPKIGKLSFINVPSTLILTNNTPKLKWTTVIEIDLKSFKEGTYSMTIKENGVKKEIKFTLALKEAPKPEPPEPPEEPIEPPIEEPVTPTETVE